MTWINATGAEMTADGWADTNMRCFGMLMDGRAQPTGIGRRGEDATMLMVLNGWHDVVKFTLPQHPGGARWSLLIDTNLRTTSRRRRRFRSARSTTSRRGRCCCSRSRPMRRRHATTQSRPASLAS